MSKILKVKEFSIGMVFDYDGVLCKIKSFPTRSSVVLESLKPVSDKWWTAKTTIRELRSHLKPKDPCFVCSNCNTVTEIRILTARHEALPTSMIICPVCGHNTLCPANLKIIGGKNES
jgi:hypothetical protein